MYTSTHLESNISDNKGSCNQYASYLQKENDTFFNSKRTNISKEEAVKMIDDHSRGGLKKEEAKWYAPMYSFSEIESQEIAYKLFGKKIKSLSEMTSDEIILFKKEIIKYARDFQDSMAENFNKSDIGISSGKDLMYIGVVEFERKYKGYDEEVKKGLKQVGDLKEGFNTHIHIIQSRKANNAKKSKISPEAKQKKCKSNLGGIIGFDRNYFYKKVEEKFDKRLQYNRQIKETFLYKKYNKKTNSAYQIGVNKKIGVLTKEILEKIEYPTNKKNRFITKKELNEIISSAKIIDYFFYLEKKGIVKFEKQIGEDYYFTEVGKINNSRISVSEKGWRDFKQYTGGGILKAVQLYEQKTWLESLNILKELFPIEKKIPKEKQSYLEKSEVIKVGKLTRNYLWKSLVDIGISEEVIKANLKQITYKNPITEKISVTMGMGNSAGGIHTVNQYSGNYIGKNYMSVIEGNSNILVFKDIREYLAFLTHHNKIKVAETVVVLHNLSNIGQLHSYLKTIKTDNIYSTITDSSLWQGVEYSPILAEGKLDYKDSIAIEKLRNYIKGL